VCGCMRLCLSPSVCVWACVSPHCGLRVLTSSTCHLIAITCAATTQGNALFPLANSGPEGALITGTCQSGYATAAGLPFALCNTAGVYEATQNACQRTAHTASLSLCVCLCMGGLCACLCMSVVCVCLCVFCSPYAHGGTLRGDW
jgi:hypothetical protein